LAVAVLRTEWHLLQDVALGEPLVQVFGDKGIVVQVGIGLVDAVDLLDLSR